MRQLPVFVYITTAVLFYGEINEPAMFHCKCPGDWCYQQCEFVLKVCYFFPWITYQQTRPDNGAKWSLHERNVSFFYQICGRCLFRFPKDIWWSSSETLWNIIEAHETAGNLLAWIEHWLSAKIMRLEIMKDTQITTMRLTQICAKWWNIHQCYKWRTWW